MSIQKGQPQSTVYILGAGFSKNAGLPLQSEFPPNLLSRDFNEPIDLVITKSIQKFLIEVFGCQAGISTLPSFEDIFTFIDLSLNSGQNLGLKYNVKKLSALKNMLTYRIFSILDKKFDYSNEIKKLLTKTISEETSFIVLNWDIVLEKHINHYFFGEGINYGFPCIDWQDSSKPYRNEGVKICKMHGSSNWVYCNNCRSVFYDLDQKLSLKIKAGLVKSDFRIFNNQYTDRVFDSALRIDVKDRKCKLCKSSVVPHITTFSYQKRFIEPAYGYIWENAFKLLSEAQKWVFIGYSLPEADYEMKYLLKTAEHRLMSNRKDYNHKIIEVVTGGSMNTMDKFIRLFGYDDLKFYNGIKEYNDA